MTQFRLLVLIAAGGSLALLLGAFGFQHLGDLAPCKLCLWQRWPHAAAVPIGVAALALGSRALAWLGALAALSTAGIGLYHTGVELGYWEGPSTCTASDPGDLSADAFFEKVINAPLIRCDEVAWSMAGLSMASWNAVIALGLALIWIRAARTA
ncbi:disulfide bond formation protein, DsbB family protein [Pseudooceanicola batsensis HTCC2597]|uniref:Disulfide bond formation protein, DsbB family protein n=1 Tax=Pseudooceanicola batsensis (strain ATCC BAA-863 / DSM 15984 / KCTC 12145 / HTCC2597) TaxID=252305 RepID=A3U2H9_PSEBH|nr:disulfide bond formation protein B [Pseudooceanicola batsensis]EAQ01553.1 disulfide bond formation protein, DsbB family protein [Pseudooceanicola batsensis HTCC2597]